MLSSNVGLKFIYKCIVSIILTFLFKFALCSSSGFLNRGPRPPLGATERFSEDHEQRPLLNSSAVILQNPIDKQGTTSVDSLWKRATKYERLRTTALVGLAHLLDSTGVIKF